MTILQARRGLPVLFLAMLSILLYAGTAAAADRTRPTTPTNLRATAVTHNSVSLAWNPSTDNSGSFSYTLRELNGGQTRTVDQTQTAYTWTGLQSGGTYRFVIFARDGSGNQSAKSNTLTVSTPAAPPLTAPANLRVSGSTHTSITLAWDAVPGAQYYHMMIDNLLRTVGAQPGYTFTGLSPNSTHEFSVRAVSNLYGPWSAPITGSTLADLLPPTAPVVSGVALSPSRVQLSWTEATDDVSGVGYNVYVNGLPTQDMLPHLTAPRTVIIHNLHAETAYEFSVKAYDMGGNFSEAAVLVLATLPGTETVPPAAPGNLRAITGGGGNGISSTSFGWDWSADNVMTTAYEIYMDGALLAENVSDVHYPGVETFYTARNLAPGSTHSFTVKARDESGNTSAASNPLTVTLQPSSDTTPPSAPANLQGSTWGGCGFLDFTWSGSTDDVDAPHQLEYEIYEDGILRGLWRGEVFEGAFGRHSYYIRAVDRAGNRSAPSNEIVLDSGLDC